MVMSPSVPGHRGDRAVLLSVHVLAAIVLTDPITAGASLFPLLRARSPHRERGRDHRRTPGIRASLSRARSRGRAGARALHRISSGYSLVALVVPVFGIATRPDWADNHPWCGGR